MNLTNASRYATAHKTESTGALGARALSRQRRAGARRLSAVLGGLLPDPIHSEQQQRSLIIGHSSGGRLLLVVFTETDNQVRIISAREASARERREFEEHS